MGTAADAGVELMTASAAATQPADVIREIRRTRSPRFSLVDNGLYSRRGETLAPTPTSVRTVERNLRCGDRRDRVARSGAGAPVLHLHLAV
jgi:hypothetical protein